jgi:pimeloyl-ACP methyl ester carboxylesterase
MKVLHYKTYMTSESAPWVSFIHGAGGSSSIWYKQIREFKKDHNVLLIDLRGHGKSDRGRWKKGDSFAHIADEVKDVLNELNIERTHVIGMSLGTIVAQTMAERFPERISSLVLGGAIIRLDIRTKLLLWTGRMTKRFIPYMLLYKLFAWIIMPKKRHEESRLFFVNQAKKMCQKEFIKWFSLTKLINPYLTRLQMKTNSIPTLFLMGEEDYLFMPPVEELVRRNEEFQLITIKDSGHVCNIDQPDIFNELSIDFISMNQKKKAIAI